MNNKPTSIVLASLLYGILGILSIAGLMVEIFAPLPWWERSAASYMVEATGGLVAFLATAYGLWNLKKWAGITGIILSLICIYFGSIISDDSFWIVVGLSGIVLIGIGYKNLNKEKRMQTQKIEKSLKTEMPLPSIKIFFRNDIKILRKESAESPYLDWISPRGKEKE